MRNIFRKFILKQKLKRYNIEWIEITPLALKDYKEQVRKNWCEDNWFLERKLNRNFLMAIKSYEKQDIIHKDFGALRIIFSKEKNKIVGICNHRGRAWQSHGIDKIEKDRLNKIYGI